MNINHFDTSHIFNIIENDYIQIKFIVFVHVNIYTVILYFNDLQMGVSRVSEIQ